MSDVKFTADQLHVIMEVCKNIKSGLYKPGYNIIEGEFGNAINDMHINLPNFNYNDATIFAAFTILIGLNACIGINNDIGVGLEELLKLQTALVLRLIARRT